MLQQKTAYSGLYYCEAMKQKAVDSYFLGQSHSHIENIAQTIMKRPIILND